MVYTGNDNNVTRWPPVVLRHDCISSGGGGGGGSGGGAGSSGCSQHSLDWALNDWSRPLLLLVLLLGRQGRPCWLLLLLLLKDENRGREGEREEGTQGSGIVGRPITNTPGYWPSLHNPAYN